MSLPLFLMPALGMLVCAGAWAYLLLRMQHAGFWESQIRAYEKADRLKPPDPGAILFTGSSSIRFWYTLERDMAPLRVLNRGFGGCHLSHVAHFAERIVLPYKPWAVVVYAGENDLAWPNHKTPEDILEDFKQLVALIRGHLPETRVYFLSIKRALLRRGRWALMDRANELIKAFTSAHAGLSYIDTSTPMLDARGSPKAEFLPWYRFHLTRAGYQLWAAIVKPVLERDLIPGLTREPVPHGM